MALPPSSLQVAVFDTTFHQSMPPEAYTYALPLELAAKHRIRRYGIHAAAVAAVTGCCRWAGSCCCFLPHLLLPLPAVAWQQGAELFNAAIHIALALLLPQASTAFPTPTSPTKLHA